MNIRHSGVHKVCPSMTILISDSQSSKNIGPLWLLLSWMPYHILKEYWMPDAYPILHSIFPGEDKNDVSISPPQLGRICLFQWRNVPIPIKGMYRRSLLIKDLTELPLDQGLASSSSLGGDHGTTSCSKSSSFWCHELLFLYSGVFAILGLLRRASIIHHFHSWIMSVMSSFLSLESDPLVHIWPFLHTLLPSSHHVSFRIFHPTTCCQL